MSGPSIDNPKRDWGGYYARTQALPTPEQAKGFLETLPKNATILDFGCGSGRWAAAFHRDRPDITIDALDQHVDKAELLPATLNGERISADFIEFTPAHSYDAIWAFATLFFIPRGKIEGVFHGLAESLAPGGTMEFTMVDDCHAASAARFHGMNEADIREMLAKEDLQLVSIKRRDDTPYGEQKIVIPTFTVRARKA